MEAAHLAMFLAWRIASRRTMHDQLRALPSSAMALGECGLRFAPWLPPGFRVPEADASQPSPRGRWAASSRFSVGEAGWRSLQGPLQHRFFVPLRAGPGPPCTTSPVPASAPTQARAQAQSGGVQPLRLPWLPFGRLVPTCPTADKSRPFCGSETCVPAYHGIHPGVLPSPPWTPPSRSTGLRNAHGSAPCVAFTARDPPIPSVMTRTDNQINVLVPAPA